MDDAREAMWHHAVQFIHERLEIKDNVTIWVGDRAKDVERRLKDAFPGSVVTYDDGVYTLSRSI